MKRAVVGALFLGMLGTCWTASGQVEPSLLQPASVRKTAFEYDGYLYGPNAGKDADLPGTAAPAPSGNVAVPEPTSPSGEGGMIAAPLRDPVAADAAEGDAAAQRVPWTLPQPGFLSNHGIKAGGWIQQGITFNGDHPADHFNGPQLTNDFSNRYQMNQAWLYFVKPTQTDGSGVDLGGRVDVVYGTDWRFGQCYGLENRIDGTGDYGLILPQFYGELAIDDLTIKAGHYATFTSYEIVPAPANFFYSHSYLSSGYFDPVLVVGAQADYKLNDNWTAVAGFHRGWQMFEDPGDTMKFLGGVKWASDDKRTTASVMVDAGRQLNLITNQVNDKTSVITVVRHQFNDKLSYGSQYTVGYEANGSFATPGQNAEWYGTEQVLVYQINPKWSVGARYEWVRDDDGARVFGIGLLGVPGWTSLPGYAGSFNDLSFGVNWRPLPNLVFRPEARWDWYAGAPNGQGNLPYGGSVKSEQFTLGMDLLWTF